MSVLFQSLFNLGIRLGIIMSDLYEAQSFSKLLPPCIHPKVGKCYKLVNEHMIAISGIGKVSANNCACDMIRKGVNCIVNIGTCGSTYPLQIGHICIPNLVCDYESMVKCANHQDASELLINRETYLVESVSQIGETYSNKDILRIITVPFFAEKKISVEPYLVDNEAYGIALAARNSAVRCIIVKVVSDFADTNGLRMFIRNRRSVLQCERIVAIIVKLLTGVRG